MDKLGVKIDDTIVEQVIRFGNADISEKYLNCITEAVREYCSEIFETLRKYEYNPELMRLYVTGGGGCLIKHFGEYDEKRVSMKPPTANSSSAGPLCSTVRISAS